MFKLVGKNSELLLARLKSWRLSDGNGIEGDSLSLTINSDDIDGIPPKGEKYSVYLGEVLRDEFQISKRSISLHPREVVLVLSVAPFSIKDETGYRERKSMSWDNTTLAQIVADNVAPHGFQAFVHPRLQKIEIEHIDRTDESTPSFLYRLAKQYDAVAKPIDGRFIFAPKGEARSASGKDIETVTLSQPSGNNPQLPNFTNVSIDLDGRTDVTGVKAFYLSTENGTRQEIRKGKAPFRSIGKDRNSQQEAEQACASELRKMQREGRKLSIEAPPNPTVFAEGLLVLDSSFPGVFQGTCSIDSVSISGQGLQPRRMSIKATLTGE
ncbi:contractile injection system protein, VgrG/Pvc8 family [Vibrio sp. 99K-1]|uniref:contractile injection system protein, VgrG/Pvc8 family n=1 Tax=Vibrio sp. 99K-1 TaxID=2607603 RepID=UPI001493CE26|nr:contractile injection system protein, VgrG/Pvc8 family [Vibrio sp. 99K-1]NOI87323.1 hypothetical protein [Vibrio sp. 99K-1]